MANRKNICVLGAGVSGLSTALQLLKLGFQVHIITKDDPGSAPLKPEFSSLFPAASIIPHGINSDDLIDILQLSKDHFKKLHAEKFPGVKTTQHYELFSYDKKIPNYAFEMDKFQPFDEFRNGFYPEHPEHRVTSGWKFKAFFADWPVYFPALMHKVLSKITDLEIRELNKKDLHDLPFDIIINCTEIGSIELFGDETGNTIHRGHLINIPGAPLMKDAENHIVSYNYSPGKQVYQSEQGLEQDVYCYSRQDGLVLGGSRQKGFLNAHGQWVGEENMSPTTEIKGLDLPAQIIDLHKKILNHTFNFDLPPLSHMQSKMGYRLTRSDNNGLRIEAEEVGDKLVIHNYGHGGAGVTLSWGCAQKVIDLLKSTIGQISI